VSNATAAGVAGRAPAAFEWNVRRIPVDGGTLAVARARHERVDGGHASHADQASQASAANPSDLTEPLVLLHGFTGSHRGWDGLLAELPAGVDVIAIDLPGHGDSDFGSDAAAFSMERTARAIASALDAESVSAATFVGYSMGGRLALYFALTFADRVRRLVLESTSAGLANASERAARRSDDEDLASYVLECGIEAFVRRWERSPVLAGERRLPEPLRRELHAHRMACSAAGLAASLRGMGTGTQPWLGERLAEISVPVLVVAGGNDEKFTSIARSMAAHVPRAELRVVADAGHNVHLERPAVFAGLLEEFMTANSTYDPEDTK
jgi:2-succinyl-6-hydroxy-2,4-cyclohexadiene-1-carboxylate synthase